MGLFFPNIKATVNPEGPLLHRNEPEKKCDSPGPKCRLHSAEKKGVIDPPLEKVFANVSKLKTTAAGGGSQKIRHQLHHTGPGTPLE